MRRAGPRAGEAVAAAVGRRAVALHPARELGPRAEAPPPAREPGPRAVAAATPADRLADRPATTAAAATTAATLAAIYGGYYGYPYWGFGWGWGWPYWGGGWGYPAPYWGYYDPSPEIRLEVKPKEAQVYVDGYFAGIVDDFDGTFQRLRMRPGNHELTLHLNGYRTVTQNIHVGQGQDSKIKYQMEPLAAGEANEPPPQPKTPPEDYGTDMQQGQPGQPAQPRQPLPPRQPPSAEVGVQIGQGFGALVIRVQPSGAEILVDGERWQGPEGSERLVIQLAEGAHRVEVRKDGFVSFSTTVQVRRGETAPLNVSLPPRGE